MHYNIATIVKAVIVMITILESIGQKRKSSYKGESPRFSLIHRPMHVTSRNSKAITINDRESVYIKKVSTWRSELRHGNCSWA